VVGSARRVEGVGLEVASQALGVTALGRRVLQLFDVVGEQVLQVAPEPHPASPAGEQQGSLRKAALQAQLHIPAQVRGVCRHRERAAVGELVDEGPCSCIADALADRHRVHRQAQEAPGTGPDLVLVLGPYRAGEKEATRTRIGVDGAAGCSEDSRHLLPLVEQHGLREATERGVRIRPERRRLRFGAEILAVSRTK